MQSRGRMATVVHYDLHPRYRVKLQTFIRLTLVTPSAARGVEALTMSKAALQHPHATAARLSARLVPARRSSS